MNIKGIISTTLLYGIPLGILLNFAIPVFLTGDQVYLGDDKVSLLMFLLVCGTYFFVFRHYFQKYTNQVLQIPDLIVLGGLFSFVVAVCLGLGHFINATFIDPMWVENSLELLQQQWAAGNYSETAIAGQIELTDTFQNPWKWSLVLIVFFTILYGVAGGITGVIYYLFYKLRYKATIRRANFQ